MGSAAFRQLLEDGDVDGIMRRLAMTASHLPQPKNREQAEIMMHVARTAAETITLPKRRYSDQWLRERGLPSKLPDDLKPTIAEAVGISVNFRSKFLAPAALEIRGAMEHAVEDCYANGDTDVATVRQQMSKARDKTMKALFGR